MSTIKFAYASVVAISDIKAGDIISEENIWVKRPGTGQIMAKSYPDLLGRRALVDIPKNQQLKWCQLDIENAVTEVA